MEEEELPNIYFSEMRNHDGSQYNGFEHAWQAKYFLGNLGTTQWKQISESVESALAKHPNLTQYCVCLSRDWNDSRKKGRGGQTINSNTGINGLNMLRNRANWLKKKV